MSLFFDTKKRIVAEIKKIALKNKKFRKLKYLFFFKFKRKNKFRN